MTADQIITDFRDAMLAAGLTPPQHIHADGKVHRFSTSGKRWDKAGWYCLHLDGLPAGIFGDWRQGITVTWCSKSDSTLSPAERQTMRDTIRRLMAQRDAELQQKRQDAQAAAMQSWAAAGDCTGHPYLTRKGVQGYGLRQYGGLLMIPLRDTSGTLHSIQTITPDGGKRFQSGGRVQGCYHAIGKPDGVIVVCEGYATGASIHAATGHAVAVAFNAGNLQAVASALHKRHPALQIIVAADDDHATPGNPGMEQARQAALAVGGTVVVPMFHASRPAGATDFNDLHQLQGLAAVTAVFDEITMEDCP